MNSVLLFYRDFERDTYFKNDRVIKRWIKPLYHRFHRRHKTSGFRVWFELLVKGLEQSGYEVEVNNYNLAMKNPNYPIGICGYPSILDNWTLPNPAILGPGLFDHPAQKPDLMSDTRYKNYVITCDWMMKVFQPVFGDACFMWHAGIETDRWPDLSHLKKTVDVLIYDKIRWHRDRYEPEFIDAIKQKLTSRGLTYDLVRYGNYDYSLYSSALAKSRSLLFLCEHETQGMAYQEAMSCNLPVLAWNIGIWQDPKAGIFSNAPIETCSVPYFSEECGLVFTSIEDFDAKLTEFIENLASYTPRNYVLEELSFAKSAELYMEKYTLLKPE